MGSWPPPSKGIADSSSTSGLGNNGRQGGKGEDNEDAGISTTLARATCKVHSHAFPVGYIHRNLIKLITHIIQNLIWENYTNQLSKRDSHMCIYVYARIMAISDLRGYLLQMLCNPRSSRLGIQDSVVDT